MTSPDKRATSLCVLYRVRLTAAFGWFAFYQLLHALTCVGEGDRRRTSDAFLRLKAGGEGVDYFGVTEEVLTIVTYYGIALQRQGCG